MRILLVGLLFSCFFQFTTSAKISLAQMISPVEIRVEGFVRDESGAAIANAAVKLILTKSITLETRTDENGKFVFNSVKIQTGKLIVTAASFARSEQNWNLDKNHSQQLEVTLTPAGISEQVTVTRSETRLEETPASIVVITNSDFETTAAVTLDDRLRQVPGFSLFRRAGSRTANPTAQGVSLRGVGASGASRALVLVDSVPLNDPFGGWIYWGRVPRESVAQVEILRGASSDLYGGGAIGGTVSIVTKKPQMKPFMGVEASYGNQKTPEFSLFSSGGLGEWSASVSAEAFGTNGYILVDEPERGLVDTLANSRRAAINFTLERSFAGQNRVFASAAFYGENRQNGTPLQTNDTRLHQFVIGGDWKSEKFGAFMARTYGGSQIYNQIFSAVSANRNTETLTRTQRVPAQVFGLSAQWSQTFATQNTLVAGFDAREVRGISDETIFSNSRAISAVGAGGRELTFGVFASDVARLNSRFTLSASLRFDRWQNFRASSSTLSLVQPSALPVETVFPKRTEFALSPRASLLFKLTDNISLSASAARAFRQPTLNELYRSFRVGDVLTFANENLRAERAVSVEAGAMANGFNSRLYLRWTLFSTEISRPIANVTLQTSPNLITRQRQNLGRTRSRGLELDVEMRLANHFTVSAGYLFVDARVQSSPANIVLENLLIPQVARHQFAFQLQYANRKFVQLGLQIRTGSAQFDDDLNRFQLNKYFTLDALVSRPLTRSLNVFVAAENLFDNRIETGRTPVITLAAPRTFRIGFRFRLGDR
jgi:outer membrane receptor protein involved in Fe transport